MNYSGHLCGGIVTSTIMTGASLVYSGMNFVLAGICGITTLIFSLYPDLDSSSTPSRHAFIVSIPIICLLIYLHHYIEAILLLILIVVPKMFIHRGLVHTLKFGFGSSIVWFFILNLLPVNIPYLYIASSTLIGYMTHLILDSHVRI